MPAAASAGITLRAAKSFQSLNCALLGAATMALACDGVIFASFSSCASVAVFKLTLDATGVVAPVVECGVVAGALVLGVCLPDCPGCIPCAKAGAHIRVSAIDVVRRWRVVIAASSLWFARPLAEAERCDTRRPQDFGRTQPRPLADDDCFLHGRIRTADG